MEQDKDFNLNLIIDESDNEVNMSGARSFQSISGCNSSTSVPCALATNITEQGCSSC